MIAQSPFEWSYSWTGKTSGVAGESAGSRTVPVS